LAQFTDEGFMGRPLATARAWLGTGVAAPVNDGTVDLVAAVNSGPDLLAVVDGDGSVRALSGAVEAILAGPTLPGESLFGRLHPDDVATAAEFLATVASDARPHPRGPVQWRAGAPDKGWRPVEATATNRLADPAVSGIVLVLRDVAERAEREDRLRHEALHDELTGLPNRSLFYDRLEHSLNAEGQGAGLLYLDFDGFKAVNDEHGHDFGDEVLIEIARRLSGVLRSGDTAARLGGDEFGVLLHGVAGPNDAVQAAQRILAGFRDPLALGREKVALSPSIGIATTEGHELAADELLRRADLAMFEAKRSAVRRWSLYHPLIEPVGRRKKRGPVSWFARSRDQREEIETLLDRTDAITSVYQPILDLRTGLVAGYEALARFPRSNGKNPAEWFAQAHRAGLGFQLEARAIASALSTHLRPARTFLSVNVSPSALCSHEVLSVLPDDLHGVLVEITENEHVPDDAAFHAVRDEINRRGGSFAVDDAGSGYAGLRQLMRLQPDVLKLDRSVVDGVSGDPAKAALVESLVRYARDMGATLCAEGIETLEDLELLADLDVTYGQGYVIARPGTAWPNVAVEAAHACVSTFSASLGRASSDTASGMAHDRRLEWLTWRLSEARDYAELTTAIDLIAEELHADELTVSAIDEAAGDLIFVGAKGPDHFDERYHIADYPQTERILNEQETAQVLHSDPAADPGEISVLDRLGMRSVLILPIVCAGRSIGLFEAYSEQERPWSRFEIGRARIICLQLGAAMDRIARSSAA
jgi:diguanylate cyclase (GGDEF)-like protein